MFVLYVCYNCDEYTQVPKYELMDDFTCTENEMMDGFPLENEMLKNEFSLKSDMGVDGVEESDGFPLTNAAVGKG